jgi:periplasmic divalent cation tolerance protein
MTLPETTDARLVLTTTDSEADARRLARLLVEEGLAACVAIAPIHATYRWQGAIETGEEWQLTIKTAAPQIPVLSERLRQEHRYAVPELLVLPVLSGDPAYLAWLAASLGPGGI